MTQKSTFTYYSSYSVFLFVFLLFFFLFFVFWVVFKKINLLLFLCAGASGTGLHYRRVQDYFLSPAKKNLKKKKKTEF
jgi:hypothetical protein